MYLNETESPKDNTITVTTFFDFRYDTVAYSAYIAKFKLRIMEWRFSKRIIKTKCEILYENMLCRSCR